VISNDADGTMADQLRSKNYGVTSWMGRGKDGERLVMEILAKRTSEQKLYQHIFAIDPKAFIVTLEPRHFHGGFWTKTIRK
jgi:uncharacterized protein YebE (UPF0316 family)